MSQRGARFVCCIAVVFPDGKEFVVRGTCEGTIGFEEKGSNGFGYDNLFIVNKYDKTFAELPATIKNAIVIILVLLATSLAFIKALCSNVLPFSSISRPPRSTSFNEYIL